MAVAPQDFLLIARRFNFGEEGVEIELRNAYRCAYYAVHHAAKQVLPRLNLTLIKADKGGSHADVEVSLLQAGTEQSKEVVAQMRRLKKFRVDCDYHLEKVLSRNVASARMAEAEVLFNTLQAMGGSVLAETINH
ncbi:hypothetical protein [Pseudomonas capsici]|uniref:hypothetical protein n=1 Tax=Pseudomonas capsici TaxID=2810614 RepID=UPI0021F1712D|nr:hypothetical protein [Pseudomonas capsici]MCV4285116.1 hypothetical protein [Pseudomonas capsici]